MANPILSKFIFEVKYPAAAVFHDKKGSILQKMQDDRFEHWRLDTLIINSFNEEKTRLAFTTSRNFGTYFEFPESNFKDSLFKYIRIVSRELSIRKILRIGVRTFYLLPMDSLEDAKNIFSKTVFNEFLQIIQNVGTPNDFESKFNFQFDKQKGQLSFGPMDSEQLINYFIKGTIDKEILNVPESFMFFDFDLFQDENYEFPKTDDLITHISKFCNSAEEIILSKLNPIINAFEIGK